VLKVQAGLWAVFGIVLAALPAQLLRALDQPVPVEGAWLRAMGAMAIVLAMLMWLVAQHSSETWWWVWAFALLEMGIATILILNALLGLPDGAAAWPWWALGIANIVFGALDLLALARAGQEKPII
jgi:hypothetical protein